VLPNLLRYVKNKPISLLLLAVLAVLVGEILHWGDLTIFALSALAVIPLANYIGEATEALAHYTGPRLGGLLNATLGNAAELIITIVAIREGLLELVKASITGSIIGNLLLVLGMAMFLGGIKNGQQSFDRRSASSNSILLILSVLILLVPSLFSHYIGADTDIKVEVLSLGVAAVMIVIYVLGLLYSFRAHPAPLIPEQTSESHEKPAWSWKFALVVLGLSTIGVAWLSEVLVGSIEPVVESLGVSEFFIGIIFIPLIGNVAEHLVAVQVAVRNKMTLSVEIAVASSLQIALFVAPVLVFISLAMGNPLTLIFNQFELVALIACVMITAFVAEDGESNWLEGAELLAIYIILGLAFFLLPATIK
jgi:Ca2+:H+ antiporter